MEVFWFDKIEVEGLDENRRLGHTTMSFEHGASPIGLVVKLPQDATAIISACMSMCLGAAAPAPGVPNTLQMQRLPFRPTLVGLAAIRPGTVGLGLRVGLLELVAEIPESEVARLADWFAKEARRLAADKPAV